MNKVAPLGIMVLYLLVGTIYVFRTPAWQSPDEPAHYNYVRQLADGEAPFFPVMQRGDYDESYQNKVRDSCFHPSFSIESYQYEDYQPPLYYMLLVPSYWVFDGALWAVRLTSIFIGAGLVGMTWLIGRSIFPGRDWIALSMMIFVAFVPQHLAILASLNNDAVANLLIASIIYLLLKRHMIGLTILLGLAFLTKVTAYLMAGVVGVVFLWQLWGDWRKLFTQCLYVFMPALAIGCLWWGRNLLVYTGFDWLGIQAHDAVVQGQLTTADYIAQFGQSALLSRFGTTTFNSFFGQFGWMSAPFPAWMYRPLLGMVSMGIIGTTWRLLRWKSTHKQLNILLILSTLLGLNLLLYVVYNLQFVQHQGRYLFPSMIPIAIVIIMGIKTIIGEKKSQIIIPAGLLLGLLYLNYVALRFIIPTLHHLSCV